MTVKDLIEQLKNLPQNEVVYVDGGDYKDNYLPISKVYKFSSWGDSGYCLK